MKVLHVIPSVSAVHGGPSLALAQMERALTGQAVEVDTATTDDAGRGLRNGKPLGMPLRENAVTRRYFRKRLDFYKVSPGLAWWVVRHVRQYDVVHIHALFSFSSLMAAWAAWSRGVPYVLRPLGTLDRYGMAKRRPWLKRLSLALFEGPALRRAAAVHFTSELEMSEAAPRVAGMRGIVIPLGIDAFEPIHRHVLDTRFPALAGHRYVLFLSRLDPKKNVEGLLQAFALCRARSPGVKLLVAGDGLPTYVAGLKAICGQLALDDSVVWAGQVDGDIKSSALAGAELFVLPSFSENFGIAAAEALMAGLPCVLGEGVAIASDVVAARAGIAVPADIARIAAALEYLLGDAPTRAAMSANARTLAREKFSTLQMGKNLLLLYSGILRK